VARGETREGTIQQPAGARDGSAMKQMQEEENKKQFARIKDLIESVGSAEELQGVWFDNTKEINALKKYAVTLFDLLVEAKDTMKVQFIG
jgi:hypothetical protein